MITPSCRMNRATLDGLAAIQVQLEVRIQRMMSALRTLEGVLFGGGTLRGASKPLYMLRNKFGLTKDQAQQLYYDMRSKEKSEKDPNQLKPLETMDEKISLIMETMQQTAVKLDRMEEDIAHLKDQVDKILKKI